MSDVAAAQFSSASVVSDKLVAIQALLAAGYILVPLCSPTIPHSHSHRPCPPKNMGKVPPVYGWQKTKKGAFSAEQIASCENYGVVLQADDLVIDIDPRNFAVGDPKPYSRLLADLGVSISSFTVKTGSGGFHIYLKKPADVDILGGLDGYKGVEFKTAGQQVVGPGSYHHLGGNHYQVLSGAPANPDRAPEALLTVLVTARRPVDLDRAGEKRFTEDLQTKTRFADYLRQAPTAEEGAQGDATTFKVAAHARDLGLAPAAAVDLLLEFWNPRCSPPWTPEELSLKVSNAYRYGKSQVGAENPTNDFAPVVDLENKKTVSWVLGKNNSVVKCFKNTLNYFFDASTGLRGVFGYNEFSVRTEFIQPAPWHRGRLPITRGVTDHDLHMLKGFLADRHRYEVSIPELESAIANAADGARFHPIREYLSSLKWDGVQRLNTWLHDYLGAQTEGRPEYLAAAGRKVICAAVMRALSPGIAFHHVLVLEGGQDLGKSSAVAILGGKWASDAPIDPHSRDTVDALRGVWFAEIAELEVFRKADGDALKAFITRPTDRVRLAYGRATGEYPRQCVFIATKNPEADNTYLKDDTGNRRYWPVHIAPKIDPVTGLTQINFDGLRSVRDQLFAEGVYLMTEVKPREPLSMHTPELKAAAKAVAERRQTKHTWTEAVAEWLERQQASEETKLRFIASRDVYKLALAGNDKDFKRAESLAIASIMRNLGWTHCHGRKEGDLRNGWRPAYVVDSPTPPPAAPVIISKAKSKWAGML